MCGIYPTIDALVEASFLILNKAVPSVFTMPVSSSSVFWSSVGDTVGLGEGVLVGSSLGTGVCVISGVAVGSSVCVFAGSGDAFGSVDSLTSGDAVGSIVISEDVGSIVGEAVGSTTGSEILRRYFEEHHPILFSVSITLYQSPSSSSFFTFASVGISLIILLEITGAERRLRLLALTLYIPS